MGETTSIAWTNRTFNPVKGCDKVSPGCKFCYAEADTKRYGLKVWGPQAPRIRTTEDYWKQPLKWNAEAQAAGVRDRVFCASWADVGEDHPDWVEARRDLARLIKVTPFLDWQLLTKRPENLVRLFGDAGWSGAWPSNVWAGTTVENQQRADERIPRLLEVPARVRFLSCEPLLGPLDLQRYLRPQECPCFYYRRGEYMAHSPGCRSDFCVMAGGVYDCDGELVRCGCDALSWVICGGESGPRGRAFELAWARALRDQCKEAGTAFFMKQMGSLPMGRAPEDGACWACRFKGDSIEHDHSRCRLTFQHSKGADPMEWPEDLRLQEFPGGHGD